MALIHCPECGKEISDQAPACIHCGYPLAQEVREAGPAPREGTYAVVLMSDVPKPEEVLETLQNRAGMTRCEACDAVGNLPFPVWQGLTLEEAYASARAFENCGVVKVVRDEETLTQEDMARADPTPPPSEPGRAEGGLGFGGTVLAVVVGIIVAVVLLSLF